MKKVLLFFVYFTVLMLGFSSCCKDEVQPQLDEKPVVTKMIDLHLHMDGAISPESARQLASMQGITIPENDAELLKLLRVSSDCHSLTEFLEKFDFPCSLMQTPEGIETATYNLCEELKAQNIIYAELKFAPQQHLKNGMTQEDAVKAAIKGLKRSTMRANLVLCCMRTDPAVGNNKELNFETIRVTQKYLGQGVCAADLAGAEALQSTSKFEDVFTYARQLGVPFTIHAGEADGPSSVRDAIRFGAKRIGHGVRSYEDPDLVKELASTKMPLMICPTSNIQTCALGDNVQVKDLPIRTYLNAGVLITINTDDPSVEGTDLKTEWDKTISAFNLTKSEVRSMMLNAVNAAFCSEEMREELRKEISAAYPEQ